MPLVALLVRSEGQLPMATGTAAVVNTPILAAMSCGTISRAARAAIVNVMVDQAHLFTPSSSPHDWKSDVVQPWFNLEVISVVASCSSPAGA